MTTSYSSKLRAVAALGALAILMTTPVHAADPKTRRVSKGEDGDAENQDSYVYRSGISGNGRFVAIESFADNLFPNDENGNWDIFVYDRKTRTLKHVSRKKSGVRGNGANEYPVISANGRFVAFESGSDNLVPDDDAGQKDIIIHDRVTRTLYRASVRSNGAEANGESRDVSLSRDGQWIVFTSTADNLVPGDENEKDDVFAHNRQTGRTFLVSRRSNGVQGNDESWEPEISDNGRFVVFSSTSSNLSPGDEPDTEDVFIHDLETRKTRLVSVRSNGDRANGASYEGIPSRNARYIAFASEATNLAPDDTDDADIFVHDRETGKTRRISGRPNGGTSNGQSYRPDISPNGRFISYDSTASDLTSGNDDNSVADIFVHDRETGKTRLVSRKTNGGQGDMDSYDAAISNLGTWVVFYSEFLFAGAEAGEPDADVYLRGPLR